MSLLSGLGDILKQYTGSNPDTTNVEQHFDQVAQSVPQSTLASGIAEAMHSNQTPPFAQMASQLFSNGNQQQKASMLTALAASAGPGILAKLTGGNSSLASLFQSGQTTVTPEQAASVNPQEVQNLAQHAEDHDPSVIDRLSQVYAQHPTLIKTLGAAALAIAMNKMSQRQSG